MPRYTSKEELLTIANETADKFNELTIGVPIQFNSADEIERLSIIRLPINKDSIYYKYELFTYKRRITKNVVRYVIKLFGNHIRQDAKGIDIVSEISKSELNVVSYEDISDIYIQIKDY
jgi:hypothetical protein